MAATFTADAKRPKYGEWTFGYVTGNGGGKQAWIVRGAYVAPAEPTPPPPTSE